MNKLLLALLLAVNLFLPCKSKAQAAFTMQDEAFLAQAVSGASGTGLKTSLVHYWPFEADATDAVGSANFTVSGTTVVFSGSGGKISGGCYRNSVGTGGATGCSSQPCGSVVDFMSTASLSDMSGGSGVSFTIAAWVFTYDACQTFTEVLTKYNKSLDNGEWYLEETPGNSYHWHVRNLADNATVQVDPVGNIQPSCNAWHLFVMGYDNGAGQAFLSIDGGGTNAAPCVGAKLGTAPSECFNAANRNFDQFQGRMGEIAFWHNRVLTSADIALVWNSGAGRAFSGW